MEDEAQSRRRSVIILHNATIVTMDLNRLVYRNGGIAIGDSSIIDIDESETILEGYSGEAREIVDLHGQIVLPGFVNTHVHTSQQLARGLAGDDGLMTFGHPRMWRFEANMTEEDSYISALLCGLELIHSGVTCFAEAGGQHVSGIARAVELLGLRACLAESIMDSGDDLPEQWANRTAKDCIQNVAEIPYDNQCIADARNVNQRTVARLKHMKILQKNLLVANTVWADDDEMGFLSLAKVKVSHCPAVAMRVLGSAPITDMLHANICVSLGTDGAPSNGRMSIVDEMYLASLINRGREVCPQGGTDFHAGTALTMATVNGAKSVLWDDEIGSLEMGLKADLVVINPNTWSMVPVLESTSSLVYCMQTENIASVMCNGRWIMKDKKILTVDEEEVLSLAKEASAEVLRRAGIEASSRMNILDS